MTSRLFRSGVTALVLFVSFSLFAQQQRPWDRPAFSADPKELVAAAAGVVTGDFPLVMILEEAEYDIDAGGAARSRERVIMYVAAEAGVEPAGEVRVPWAPWYDQRPGLAARVITRDGTVHTLDQAAVVDVPAAEQADIYSDGRVLRAPLPAVAVGSVIEYVVTRTSTNPIPGGGVSVHYLFGGYYPYERTRVSLDAPVDAQPRIVNQTGLEPRVHEKDGRRRLIFETGRIEGKREAEAHLPYDVTESRFLSFSTGSSWQDIARGYSDIVDRQIAGSDLQKMVRAAVGKSTDRGEIVARLLAAIQKDIRYAGVEIGEGSIVPRTPRQVLANKYGDCKDKASFLVAMLREAGLSAHVALLNAGQDYDIRPELPGLSKFNHAIVVVEGEPAIWVDPTDVYARAGELPLPDQGRMALIARPGTTTLTRTPEDPSTTNVYRERRTFVLPEAGKARVSEVTEPAAAVEATLRRWVTSLDSKALRENLEGYAKGTYVAKKLEKFDVGDPVDLRKPFRLALEVPESESGITGEGEAAVVVNVAGLPQHIPAALRDWKEPQPGDDPANAPKPRKHDFLFPIAGVREWAYRIVPPAGYVPRTLPPSETKQIGTMTYSQELHVEPDQTVVATFRFDSGKRRLTPAEFQATRVAFTKFIADNTVTIGFDQIGQVKLNAGDVRGALDEFRRLQALHPKEAQHHLETARALLASGLGEAARDEVRRAIAIEPKNARTHLLYGNILLHDSLGRAYRKGFDSAGALAAYRKAKELDGSDLSIRVALAAALTFGTDGIRFGRGARLAEAAEEYESMAADLGDEGKVQLPQLILVYSHMGRFQDVRELAPTLEDTEQRDLARLLATAALDGSDAVLRELGAFDPQRRRTYAAAVAQTLVQLRIYPQAAAVMEAAAHGTTDAAEMRQYIELLKKLKRREDTPRDEGPRGVVLKFMDAMLYQDAERFEELLPPERVTEKTSFSSFDPALQGDLPLAVFGDVLATLMEVQQDGDDKTGYRLRIRTLGTDGSGDMALYVRQENGRWLFRGMSSDLSFLGQTVLGMAERNELETARQWVNWIRDEVKGGSGDDPLDGSPLAAVWTKSKASASAEEIRLAAAIMGTKIVPFEKVEPILLAGRGTAATDAARAAIDVTLASLYETNGHWAKMLVVTERLVAAHPDSATAFSQHVAALHGNGKLAEAVTLAKQRLERLPNDRNALSALAKTAARGGDFAEAQRYAMKVVDDLRPARKDYREAAWLALFTGTGIERAIEHAQHAAKDEQENSARSASLNTLAALYAESGRNAEARDALLQGLDAGNRAVLDESDWYVLGRVAENYGVEDFAIQAYRKVGKETGGASVSKLAQRRLKALERPARGRSSGK